jgi:hypothetical protein
MGFNTEQLAGLMGGPWPVGVGGGAEDVHVANLDLQREPHGDSAQGHGIDVEEVDGHRRGCLSA